MKYYLAQTSVTVKNPIRIEPTQVSKGISLLIAET
jgi:hypothetical protein